MNEALTERVLNAMPAEMRADTEAMAALRPKTVGTATGGVTDVNGRVQVSSVNDSDQGSSTDGVNDSVQGSSTDGGAPVRSLQDTEMEASFMLLWSV